MISSRDLARCGLFGAAALLLPTLFHLIHLGHVFMPMYLPLVALAFFVSPLPAMGTAFVTPLLSGVVTGMPPFFPPIAFFMAIELAVMAAVISTAHTFWPKVGQGVLLFFTLLLGRVLYVGMVYTTSRFMELPAGLIAGLSVLSGWPGVVLMMAVIPGLVRLKTILGPRTLSSKGD
ncbi:MAG: hypothetical protein WA705_22795 [Candidatus Ozemobacteraceae bacterium]